MPPKKHARRRLSAREVRGQHAAALPDREALSTLTPDPVIGYPTLPFEPIPYEPVADQPLPADGTDTPSDGAGTNQSVDAPANEATAENVNSSGATQGSSSTQSAPITQS